MYNDGGDPTLVSQTNFFKHFWTQIATRERFSPLTGRPICRLQNLMGPRCAPPPRVEISLVYCLQIGQNVLLRWNSDTAIKMRFLSIKGGNGTMVGKRLDEVTLAVRWANPLPVKGSEWWVNLYQPCGHSAHRLASQKPDASGQILVVIDRSRLPMKIPTTAALSLGAPAPTLGDPRIVSNVILVASPQ